MPLALPVGYDCDCGCDCVLIWCSSHTAGMYSKSAWGGPVDPFILAVFPNDTIKADEDPIVSLIIFEWRDQGFIGAFPDPEAFSVCAMPTDCLCWMSANSRSRKS